jgi:hypothetical protein
MAVASANTGNFLVKSVVVLRHPGQASYVSAAGSQPERFWSSRFVAQLVRAGFAGCDCRVNHHDDEFKTPSQRIYGSINVR